MPWDVILVSLDGGPLFLSNPIGIAYDDLRSGMRVKLKFIDCGDAGGDYRLPVFEADEV
jgi:uncharacterized OB-fold protein